MRSVSTMQLHHIGQVVAEIEPAAQRLILRFGYRLATPIIHDELQTAFVQFLSLPGETHCLELVAPDRPESKLANAVNKRGSRLHHLCYIAGPLESEIAALTATGMRLISDPKPAMAFDERRICWLLGEDQVLVELVERREPHDLCVP